MGTVPILRSLAAGFAVLAVLVACANGEGDYGGRFTDLSGASPELDAGRDARRASNDDADDEDDRPPARDASADANDASTVSGKVSCGGYDYPEVVTVPAISCTGYVSGCTGAHVFRAVGCYTTTPAGNPCPGGMKIASLMLVGQWAQAANITRLSSGSRACMWTFGSSPMTSACGGESANYAYCWTKSGLCAGGGCASQCCEGYPSGAMPCTDTSGAAYPLLCVQ